MERTIGIPYAKPGMRSSTLEELLNQLIEELHDEGYGPEFEANWAKTIMSELGINDAYFVTCPECDEKLYGKAKWPGTEDDITKSANVRYARHYAWKHTKERLGSNLSAIVIDDA